MNRQATGTGIEAWLGDEIAKIETSLAGQAPTCQLDRQRVSPPSLKYSEGRYFVLRQARRLLAQGQSLQPVQDQADKARAFLAGDGGPLAHDRQWVAYQQGVLEAAEAVLVRGHPDGG